MPLAITPTFNPWTHTSDDSYIYQLSLVLATATVSYDTWYIYIYMVYLLYTGATETKIHHIYSYLVYIDKDNILDWTEK